METLELKNTVSDIKTFLDKLSRLKMSEGSVNMKTVQWKLPNLKTERGKKRMTHLISYGIIPTSLTYL